MAFFRNAECFFQHGLCINAWLKRRGGRCNGNTLADGIAAAALQQNALLQKFARNINIPLL
jgi:hypothetical protein